MRLLSTVVLAVAAMLMLAVPANAADRDCSDFDTQREAQDYYENKGGPHRDPDRLDDDDDGIACETLPRGGGGGGGGHSSGPPRPRGTDCVNLRITPRTKPALRRAFRRAHPGQRPRSRGPKNGMTYFARCGSTYWALATFLNPATGGANQPEAFRRRAGGRWVDRGDNGVCAIPAELVRVWRVYRLTRIYACQVR